MFVSMAVRGLRMRRAVRFISVHPETTISPLQNPGALPAILIWMQLRDMDWIHASDPYRADIPFQ
jgi:hypothetical protein